MANLKYRWSKTRTRNRRANFKAEAPTFAVCSNCGTLCFIIMYAPNAASIRENWP